jgi:hypothetical protein
MVAALRLPGWGGQRGKQNGRGNQSPYVRFHCAPVVLSLPAALIGGNSQKKLATRHRSLRPDNQWMAGRGCDKLRR